MILDNTFFNHDACKVANALLGKVICHKHQGTWLCAQIIETEAYYLTDKASHASLGLTEKRKALFMPPGTIYMYYARGGDSLNISCKGDGNAVLIKSGFPYLPETDIALMQTLNPPKNGTTPRVIEKLCCGQTLLCKALGIKVEIWDQQQFSINRFYIKEVGYQPQSIIQTTRLGIPLGRDEHLPYRFILGEMAAYCTKKTSRSIDNMRNSQ
jgi:DNA-3-methyladenine glycosylase